MSFLVTIVAQGSYVTLGFRRKEGNETTYYDVPLMRGSSEFFDSMKSNQPLHEEIERLKRANAGLEAQRARDASELQRYRSHMERQREDFDRKFLAMDQALSEKDAELTRLQGEISRLLAATRSAQGVKGDLEKLREAYDRDQKRVEEKEIARQHEAEAQRKMFEEERSRYESTIKRLELDLATQRREVTRHPHSRTLPPRPSAHPALPGFFLAFHFGCYQWTLRLVYVMPSSLHQRVEMISHANR